jgi:hypothetical protein
MIKFDQELATKHPVTNTSNNSRQRYIYKKKIGNTLHLLRYKESRIETNTKLANQIIVCPNIFVFL